MILRHFLDEIFSYMRPLPRITDTYLWKLEFLAGLTMALMKMTCETQGEKLSTLTSYFHTDNAPSNIDGSANSQ